MSRILDLSNPQVEKAFLECLDSHLKLQGIQGKSTVDIVLSAVRENPCSEKESGPEPKREVEPEISEQTEPTFRKRYNA